jgi:hypothetical protein
MLSHMSGSETFAPTDALRVVASFGSSERSAPETITPSPELWDGFLDELQRERLTGLAVASAQAGSLRLDEAQTDGLLERHRGAMLWALELERMLLDLVDVFEAGGVESIVLKGPALAHSMYPDPSWRPFADIDLLVRTRDWRAACSLLEERGARRLLPEPRPGFDESFGKGALYVADEGREIDLHRTLALGPFGQWIDPDELFDHTAGFSLGGKALRRLDDTASLAHVCIHSALGFRTPIPMMVRDVAQVGRSGQIDWDVLEGWAERWRLGVVFQRAMGMASETCGVSWPAEAQGTLRARSGTRERKALEAYVTERRSRGGTNLSTVRAIRGVRGKAAFLRALLLPDPEFLEARAGGSYRRRWTVALGWVEGVLLPSRRARPR